MQDDLISEIRYALRSALYTEDVHPQSTIFFTVMPGQKPKWASAPSESMMRIFALDRALSRGNEGFLGREWYCPSHPNDVVTDREYEGKDKFGKLVATPQKTCKTCGGPLQNQPRGTAAHKAAGTQPPEELGSWHVVGLPMQTASGYKGKSDKFPGPEPWVVFMDWLWDFLKAKGLNPAPLEGFGNMDKPYNQLTPSQKRQRKYGKAFQPQMEPGEELPSALKAASAGGTANWPKGFDIGKDVALVVDSLGKDQDEVSRNFQKLLSTAKVPSGMRIIPSEDHRWFVEFMYETDDPSAEYETRRKSVDAYKGENREKWVAAIRKLAGGRTNPAQLAPLVRRWLVAKHQFGRPFHVDILSPEDFARAIEIINNANLDELVSYAKEAGEAPPVVGTDPVLRGTDRQQAIMARRWTQIINRIADEGGVEPALVEVALANYLTQKGFDDPFEFDMASPAKQATAINAVSSLTFDDIHNMLESVQNQVRSLME